MVPEFFTEAMSFFGIFDGTVGPDASEYLMQNITKHLVSTAQVADVLRAMEVSSGTDVTSEFMTGKVKDALRSTFMSVDQALIDHCAQRQLHYASSTGVTAFLWNNLLTVAHIGDSKACISKVRDGEVLPEWLTIDHKPDMPLELERIEANGGSLAWLHGHKPYIRGGDFFPRQANNEHPKQLNYSRAFGGKDLKPFGLSAEPDINHFEITPDDKVLLLGSDGLWDVLPPKLACEIALNARREGRSASEDIVMRTIQEMPICGVRDNITVVVVFLND
jgi:protein phosphatase